MMPDSVIFLFFSVQPANKEILNVLVLPSSPKGQMVWTSETSQVYVNAVARAYENFNKPGCAGSLLSHRLAAR